MPNMSAKRYPLNARIILFFLLVFFVSSYKCYAAPCYGTRMPQKKTIFLGLGQHTIFKRYLANQNGKFRSSQEFLLLSYGLYDWLSIDLKGGAGLIKQHPVESDELDYTTFMGGGYGLRVRLWERDKAKAVFGFQHISIHPRTIEVEDVKHKAVLDDWQFSLLTSYEFKRLTPYLGTKWSRADYIHWRNGERKRIKSDLTRSLGLVAGLDIPITEMAWINLEGQFLDGEACAFSLNLKF
jgi:hypothetical protein